MTTNVGNPKESCPFNKVEEPEEIQDPTKHWIKFRIKDNTGTGVSDVTVQITLPDNNVVEKTSDENGLIVVNNIDPGNCKIVSDLKNVKISDTVVIE
ncbi:MAG TPA: hypothetical protein QF480_09775 [Bacteroidales bacterium]|jgi:hypothetical protein|nr:hypothetical protein [Bacteroidales bacterium]|tara:strand:- start:277 stop:567 length:291 start_codon:yes stop_codon:yes gene_type:complete